MILALEHEKIGLIVSKDIHKKKLNTYRVYEGWIRNGRPHGFGRNFFPSSMLTYTGYMQDDILKGKGIATFGGKSKASYNIEGVWYYKEPPSFVLRNEKGKIESFKENCNDWEWAQIYLGSKNKTTEPDPE